ncbi:aminodeoxychorismate/anthranilate synthase component II [Bacillus sp. MUM 116]|uniref:anthranilate synthase component II n=1 Tax=Bacillus sp. MUM 116 TaxID=1678002 RepID=UPI0008F5D890|nr:aminodeoxychorismate/anthranilate synthase component II [Bacillus sp. MUM 116]OIK09566.1 aminodeoxychorismate/anthranilate synthase component II [Bacillus sp. MUM 116]
MIVLIDNFDSFTYNLYQYLGELGETATVIRNNQLTIAQLKELKPKAIILSPGPGRPEDAGICVEVIKALHQEIPILGICLGHQAIGYAFGAKISRADSIKHGKTSFITHNANGLFEYLTSPLEVMRYHSLVIEKNSLPEEFESVAISMDDQEVMAIKHRHYPVFGLQFHPESIGTPTGKRILKNFLDNVERMKRDEKLFTPIS